MESTISQRTLVLVLVTGILTVTLFYLGVWTLSGSAFLVLGVVLRSRFPHTAKWMIWMGVCGWSMVLIPNSYLFLRNFPSSKDPNFHSHYLYDWIRVWSPLLASTALIIWCDVELLATSMKGVRIASSMPERKAADRIPREQWIFAVALNLWTIAAAALSAATYKEAKGAYMTLMSVGWLIVTLIFDGLLITNAFLKRSGNRLVNHESGVN